MSLPFDLGPNKLFGIFIILNRLAVRWSRNFYTVCKPTIRYTPKSAHWS
jgi:hypothetical protein